MVSKRGMWVLLLVVVCAVVGAGAIVLLCVRPEDRTKYLLRCLEETSKASVATKRACLQELLHRNHFAFAELPPGVNLDAGSTQYDGFWLPFGDGGKFFCCQLICKVNFTHFTGGVVHLFLFNADGTLLAHMADSSAELPFAGLLDMDGDGIFEKVAATMYKPHLPRGREAGYDMILEVYRLKPTPAKCIFRVLYGDPDVPGFPTVHVSAADAISGLVLPEGAAPEFGNLKKNLEDAAPRLPPVSIESDRPDHAVISFRWDPATKRIWGPQGGPGEWWQVVPVDD